MSEGPPSSAGAIVSVPRTRSTRGGALRTSRERKFSRWVAAQPHSVRLWLTPLRYLGKPVWIGQVSAVQGGRFAEAEAEALRTDPNVDASRTNVVADLIYSQGVSKLGFVAGARRTGRARRYCNQ